jgi:hypothetical protein
MNPDELKQICFGLSEISARLKALKQQPTTPPPPWPQVQLWVKEAHKLFSDVIDLFVSQCEIYYANISTDTRLYEDWRRNLADLWRRMDYLRSIHNQLFCHDYTSVIYHHIFIEELFSCFPKTLEGAQSKFLLLPSGDLVVWPLAEALGSIAPDWFQEKFLVEFEKLTILDSINCFGCHRERDYERQAVLAHEIFHILVRKNKGIQTEFKKLLTQDFAQELIQPGSLESQLSQIEEFFCDYSAAWYFGPVFLLAFVDEISFYPVGISGTHPPNDLRAAFLLENNVSAKAHRSYSNLQQYLALRKRTGISLPSSAVLKKGGDYFEMLLNSLKLQKYKHIDRSEEIGRSFTRNIPYVVPDIRTFINNLPSNLDGQPFKKFTDLVSESLRKTNLLRQVMPFVLEPGLLFSVPPAFKPTPKTVRKSRKR